MSDEATEAEMDPWPILQEQFERLASRVRSFIKSSDEQEEKFKSHERFWKLAIIVGTGLLAIINITIPLLDTKTYPFLGVFPAVLAVMIGVLANIDSYSGYGRLKRQHGERARAMRVSLYRNEVAWKVQVLAEAGPQQKLDAAKKIITSFGEEIAQIVFTFDPYGGEGVSEKSLSAPS